MSRSFCLGSPITHARAFGFAARKFSANFASSCLFSRVHNSDFATRFLILVGPSGISLSSSRCSSALSFIFSAMVFMSGFLVCDFSYAARLPLPTSALHSLSKALGLPLRRHIFLAARNSALRYSYLQSCPHHRCVGYVGRYSCSQFSQIRLRILRFRIRIVPPWSPIVGTSSRPSIYLYSGSQFQGGATM